jgi:phosphoribosyl 1,2-cyclic phosphate phosphodiesterase
VLNALRKEPHISHFTLQEALELIAEIKPQKAYLTHISHQLGLAATVEAELPPNVHLAYDGLQLSF